MGKLLLVLLCISTGLLSACNKSSSGNSSAATAAEDQVTAAGVTMQWNVAGSDLAVTVKPRWPLDSLPPLRSAGV